MRVPTVAPSNGLFGLPGRLRLRGEFPPLLLLDAGLAAPVKRPDSPLARPEDMLALRSPRPLTALLEAPLAGNLPAVFPPAPPWL